MLGLVLLALSGCKLITESDSVCPPQVAVAVDQGAAHPLFPWTEQRNVLVTELTVRRPNHGEVVWTITGSNLVAGQRLITPPVRYGAVPEGARQGNGPVPLQAGTRYEVSIHGGYGGSKRELILCHLGSAEFTQ